MVIPKGYKQTEIGVIPEEWENKPLKMIAPLQRGFDLPYSDIVVGCYPVVFSNGTGSFHNRYMVKGPGVVTGRSGTIGKVSYIQDDFWPHNTTLWVTDFLGNNAKFIYYLFTTINWRNYNSGSSVPTLNRNDIHSTIFACPPLPEQEKIAEALSDTDELISSLEKLIAKKKAIKQGAMQQLLTGKARLPGFNGEWYSYNFGDTFDFIPNNAFTREQMTDHGYVKNIHYGDILTKFKEYLDAENPEIPYIASGVELSRFPIKNYVLSGDIIIDDTAEDNTVGKALEIINVKSPMLSGQHTLLCRPKIKFATKFLGYYLNSPSFHNQMLPYVVGTKVSSISKTSISQLSMYVPELKEQEKIAAAFSDMDSEIDVLEQKLNKYRQIKQGMMQQLLTGKIRLVDSMPAEKPEPKIVDMPQPQNRQQGHNHQFDDAVVIAAIVDTFYSDKYPLGRVKVQKLLYLLRRHQEASVAEFKKKAAGPYADTVRYKGGEQVAIRDKYIVVQKSDKGTRFYKGENVNQALEYVNRWNMSSDIQWLKDNFLYSSRDDLELYATVDMAMNDLTNAGISISVDAIKGLIKSNKDWKGKLAKPFFNDENIRRAIVTCKRILA